MDKFGILYAVQTQLMIKAQECERKHASYFIKILQHLFAKEKISISLLFHEIVVFQPFFTLKCWLKIITKRRILVARGSPALPNI